MRKHLGRSIVPYQIKLNNGDLIFCPMDVEVHPPRRWGAAA